MNRIRHRLWHRGGNWWPYGWGCRWCDAEREEYIRTSPALQRLRENLRKLGLEDGLDRSIRDGMAESRKRGERFR